MNEVLEALRRLVSECIDEHGALLRPSFEAVRQAQEVLAARGIVAPEGRRPQGGVAKP